MIVMLFIINTELLNICFPIYKHKDLTKKTLIKKTHKITIIK